jgi:ankyrin repeat protein
MNYIWIFIITSVLSISITGCGKKAEVKDPNSQDKTITPSSAELDFYVLKEMRRTVYENDLKGLQKVLKENPLIDLDAILVDGDTYLIVAIKNDFREIRNYLIERGASVEKANINKNTPLLVAASSGMVNSVKILLDLKVDIEKRNNQADTALHLAIKNSQDEIALLLVKQGANVEALDGKNMSSLRLAENFKVPLVLELLKMVSQVEFGAPDIPTFISILNRADFKQLITVLNRFPRLANEYEIINPLAILVESNDESLAIRSAELLINFKVNVDGPKEAEMSPLIKATKNNKSKFANFYLSSNANPQLLDKDGKSALIHAVELNNLEMVKILLSFSAVEKYTFRKDGRKITYSACEVASSASKKLKTEDEKKINKKIKDLLSCGLWGWPF